MKRVSGFGKISLEWDVFFILLPSTLRNLCGIRDVKIVRVKRWYTAPRKQKQQGSCTQTLTETVTTCTRLVQVKNRSETQIEEGKVSANSHL